MEIKYIIADWEKHKDEISFVRYEVFVNEQNVPAELELEEADKRYIHILALDGKNPVATARLTLDGHIGRVAVLKKYRKYGIGKQLMLQLEETASEMGFDEIKIDAQCHAVHFYRKLGYDAYGEVFLDAGIDHIHMKKNLS